MKMYTKLIMYDPMFMILCLSVEFRNTRANRCIDGHHNHQLAIGSDNGKPLIYQIILLMYYTLHKYS